MIIELVFSSHSWVILVSFCLHVLSWYTSKFSYKSTPSSYGLNSTLIATSSVFFTLIMSPLYFIDFLVLLVNDELPWFGEFVLLLVEDAVPELSLLLTASVVASVVESIPGTPTFGPPQPDKASILAILSIAIFFLKYFLIMKLSSDHSIYAFALYK